MKPKKNDYSRRIEEKRYEMIEEAKKHGITSWQVLKKSKELDELIFTSMKEK
ncbi:aspartyl-phosphate phosphatase Spo0E family protein [Paucisalibacillus globulus]|jgi:endo-1,4-beta-mannosidase|uniref:aspartyl-phosphate phosphatase Spo0E family protein n=1 Tax=Paucisalibacillus globulus TaxID=351095 RepID=UPI00040C71D6|nr:aspartyl-phosphate phosphatase Spo0E family protein [Paucisalibacillus globulus]